MRASKGSYYHSLISRKLKFIIKFSWSILYSVCKQLFSPPDFYWLPGSSVQRRLSPPKLSWDPHPMRSPAPILVTIIISQHPLSSDTPLPVPPNSPHTLRTNTDTVTWLVCCQDLIGWWVAHAIRLWDFEA